ncbi:putative uncharacterized protein [Desulfovibrio ferrophilus]|uniref:Uncharacterized protein n=2 Tax=Desulfovibrio ferrophilus TaxID=241368 RepID=A0A2Z6AX00_9BACT|nr:putative uncharacterized protein [Desulfovibrio ferrophilus]
MDSSQSSTSIINVTFKDRTEISVSGMHVEYKIVSDWNEWQNTIKQQAEFDLIVSPTFHSIKVKSGGYIDVEDLIRWTSKNSDVPFFTNQDYTVFPEGAVGAYTLDAKAHGAQVAKMVASILEDKIVPRNMMYIMDRQGLFVFNEAQLKRFGISIPEPINSKATWR